MTVYIYDKNSLQVIAMPEVRFLDKFKENPNLFYPPYDNNTMIYSLNELVNPIIDNNEIKEMTEYEKVKTGKRILDDGSYLDETNETIVTISKPNEYSKWDKDSNTWVEDKAEKLKYFKELRYTKQQEYIKYKKELAEKEDEKTEFEDLGFDVSETEERITEIKAEMDLLKTEIAKLTKEIKELEK